MTELAIAVDDAPRFVAAVEAARAESPAAADDRGTLLAWFMPVDLEEALA